MLRTRILTVGLSLAALVFVISQSARAALVAEPLPTPAPVATLDAPECCLKPCIHYRHCGPKLCCDCTKAPVEMTLKVPTPCKTCEIDVVVCLPGCCEGEPKVCCTSGFRGRPVIEYEWCCGYRVRVAFRHIGDVLVTTYGR